MKRILAIVLSLALVTTGCSQVHHVDATDAATPLNEVNRSLRQENATVLRKDGGRFRVKHVSLAPDCTDIILEGPPARGTVWPTWQIDRIETISGARGALEGGLAGLFGGFAVGALLGAASYSEENGDVLISSRTDAMMLGGVFLGLVGLCGGVVVGAIAGHTDEYSIRAAASSTPCE